MYKVLIVDDERTVREGLKAVIPWEDYGFQVDTLVKDGQQALEHCREGSYDLIISDIRMAGMDGLQLIKHIREFDSKIQCLILTGYADFDYAKKAIQHNVAGYLLKPIDEESLIPALIQIKKDLDKENIVKELTLIEKERQREWFILSHLFNKSDEHEADGGVQLAKEFGIHWDKYEVLLMKMEDFNREVANMLSIKQKIKELVDQKSKKGAFVFLHEAYVGILFNSNVYKKREIQYLYQEIKEVLDDSQVKFTSALGNCVDSLSKIKISYQTALRLIQHQFFFPEGELLIRGKELIKFKRTKRVGNSETLNEIINKLYLSLELGEWQMVKLLLEQVAEWSDHVYSERTLKKNYVYILSILMNKLQKSKPNKELFFSKIAEKVLEIYHINHFQQLQQFVNNLVDELYDEFEYDQSDDQLKKLMMLIENKYYENLKLEKLADLFNYNSAYLGKLFKSYTGEYFNTYLDKVRIKNAKKFLLEGLKVYRVAEIVGYNNVDYFHSKFKKYVGISPSAYRRKENNHLKKLSDL
ncbi:response regulator [Evansella cellulosilytica]|uniref:Two component transcriptional regulator, AraC family n=1 Tax=Evansella cellulosilytica (strain ATCC 21833 / DSM 2522 / FERM P-1141 / JCM 9156 / N-4) TaxID=649639 RepID=E6TRT9_EVAC2|nr:response regulator [Evansella cellulosilytica]ADU29462.1 two component transcriptional regulator, AraC family [Evansella cellulosilytica DSM 2522]